MIELILYKCPSCYLEGSEIFVKSLFRCQIEGCEQVVCDSCFSDHRFDCHSQFQEISKSDLEEYKVDYISH